jgi:hypothetical protein
MPAFPPFRQEVAMRFTTVNPLWMFEMVADYVPPAVALVYGAVLCFRHAYRKPQATKCVATALLLLVASGAPEVVMALAKWIGFRLTRGVPDPFVIVIMQSALRAAGLALLFWTAFLDETPLEFDNRPPVYRNDDGPAADG